MILETALCGGSLLLIWLFLSKDTPPLHGVYAQRGKWFFVKYFLFRTLLFLRNARSQKGKKRKAKAESNGPRPSGYGVKSFDHETDMDCAQPLSDHPLAIDTHYYNGFNSDGAALILRIARRHNRTAEVWITMNIPGEGFYQAPFHPYTTAYNTDPDGINGAGMTFECLEPMRRWKISYNGILRKGLCNDWEAKDDLPTCHVKFSFIWEAVSEAFDFDTDSDPSAVAEAIAREEWTKEFWKQLRSTHQTHYEQQGEMRGIVKVEGKEERSLILKSFRDHTFGVRDWSSFYRYVVHFILLEDGSCLHVNVVSIPGALSMLRLGYMSLPNGVMIKVTDCDLDLPNLGLNRNPPQDYSFNFTTNDGKNRHVEIKTRYSPEYYHHDDWRSMVFEKVVDVNCDGVKGTGIAEWLYRCDTGCPVEVGSSVDQLKEPDVICETDLSAWTLRFDQSACSSSSLVGGKGCQLALLTQMTSEDFIVPKGFCLTVNVFQHHYNGNQELADKLNEIQQVSIETLGKPLEMACDEMVEAVLTSSMANETVEAIWKAAEEIFPAANDIAFAVRSSAIGEDGADLSSAGQMDTILGVKGKQSLLEAVLKCWASNFSYIAVQYRRQHGQPLNRGMGVVIQEMAPVTSAGVLFTLDPVTSDPGVMVINANYGLGESVVSGCSEPDLVKVKRTWENKLSLLSEEIGSKKTLIKMIESGGIKEEEVSEKDAKLSCLSQELALRLAAIGIELEKRFSDPRDIEWAVDKDDNIYLLQARPITTMHQDTEWEMIHEFDSPLVSDSEWLTTCNIGEMMPGAVTPLTYSTFFRAIDHSLQRFITESGLWPKTHNFFKFLCITCNHGFINLNSVFAFNEGSVAGTKKAMAALAIAGDPLEEFTLEMVERHNGHVSLPRRICNALRNFKLLYQSYGKCVEWEKKAKTYSLLRDSDDAHALYERIHANFADFEDCWTDTAMNSARSGAWSNVLMGILSHGKTDWSTANYSDVACLLAKCENVYSADVPSSLEKLASGIRERGEGDELIQRNLQEATEWLLTCSSLETQNQFSSFLQLHGHRCIREAEMKEKSWHSDPSQLVRVLISLLKAPVRPATENQDQNIALDDLLGQLQTPITANERRALRWIVPRARSAVADREWGKSLSILMSDKFKEAYWRLAELMQNEGRLPDAQLLFFLTHLEIGILLKERNGKLVSKAQRRRKLLPQMMSFKFDRINVGRPIPIEECTASDSVTTALKVKGMPVSQGQVRGRARVVTSLEDADQIEQGDVLIVTCTDVGWSPYFPLISGLVTEIGGLVSHGAVVAREYGLPCIVNVPRVTTLFNSGDQVILNGTKGSLERIE